MDAIALTDTKIKQAKPKDKGRQKAFAAKCSQCLSPLMFMPASSTCSNKEISQS